MRIINLVHVEWYHVLGFGSVSDLDMNDRVQFSFDNFYKCGMTYWETSISMQPSKSKLIGASVIQKSLILGRAVSRRRPRDLLSLSLSCLPNAHTTNSPPRQINNLSWQPAVTNGPPPMPRLNYGTRRKRNRTLLTGGARWRLPESWATCQS